MKVAVLKLGSRISFNANDTSGGNGEARSIIKMLQIGGAEVNIFTKILKKDTLLPEYKWHNIGNYIQSDIDGLDALIVLNGVVNFYGGVEDPEQILNYKIINNFKGKVFYIYCDPALTLRQVWPSVSKKPWANNWTEEDLNIVRDDIIYLSQPHDIDKVVAKFNKNEIIPQYVIHFPFEQFPCLNPSIAINPTPEVDLSYGGTMRGGKRTKKMVKFYFNHPEDISVEMFGKIKLEDFEEKHLLGVTRTPQFTGPIKYDEMLPKMNKAMAHIVIGDPYYEQINDIPQRLYESIHSSVVTFVDVDMDQIRRVYSADKELADFLYVRERQELSEKIMLLKTDPSLRNEILTAQIKAIGFDAKGYCDQFTTLIKSLT